MTQIAYLVDTDLLPTDLYILLKKCMLYLMADQLTKIAEAVND